MDKIFWNLVDKFYGSFTIDFLEIEEKEIDPIIKLNNKNYLTKAITIKNCVFHNDLILNKIDIGFGIRFIKCQFDKNVIIQEVIASGIHEPFNADNANILFDDCNINGDIIIENTNLQQSLLFTNCKNINKIHINSSKIDSIVIEDSTLNIIDVEHLETRLGLRINKSTLKKWGQYWDVNSKEGGLAFIESVFEKHQSIGGGKQLSISINNSILNDKINISGVNTNDVTLYTNKFEDGVVIEKEVDTEQGKMISNIKNLYIRNCNFVGDFEITSDKKIANAKIFPEKLNINCSALSKGNMNIVNSAIGEIKLEGINNSSSISFNDCSTNKLNVRDFINQGQLFFTDFKAIENKDSLIIINKTYLGKTFFSNCNFSSFNNVQIKHSILTEINSSLVNWFDYKNLNQTSTFFEKYFFVDKDIQLKKSNFNKRGWYRSKTNRDVFRQLKFAMQKQGDLVQSLYFKTLELKAYREEIGYYKWDKQIGTRVMLAMNQSNDFGLNWTRPIFLLLFLTLIFWIIISLGVSSAFSFYPSFKFESIKLTLLYLSNELDSLPLLLNPIRKLSEIYNLKNNPSFLVSTIDYLHRIVLSYLIFQTVSAFRKYLK